MEWHPAGWSVCLPLLIFPCTTKSRSSLLAPADPGGPGKNKRVVYETVVVEDGTHIYKKSANQGIMITRKKWMDTVSVLMCFGSDCMDVL